MFKVIMSLNNNLYVIKALKNTDVFDYNFINKDTARLVYEKLGLIPRQVRWTEILADYNIRIMY